MKALRHARVIFLLACLNSICCRNTYLVKHGKKKHEEKGSLVVNRDKTIDFKHHHMPNKKKKKLKHSLNDHRHQEKHQVLSGDYSKKP